MITELGRYKILAELGQGAMGTVYKAIDPMIDRTVAIKTIKLDLSAQEIAEYEARFQQEIKATGKLTHPNIVTIFDVGRTAKVAYMAMEFLEGQELKDVISSGKLLPVENTVDIMAQVADGLAFAHEQGVVHRDIKPSNIMVLHNGLAKITDFGIARLPNSAVKTMTGMILGSPRYMSPEQVVGSQLDYRTDLFSLGVVLYEALTGIAPFDGENVNAIMFATVNKNPPAPSGGNRNISPMLDLIVAKALAKPVEDRYQSAREFAADLREVWRNIVGKPAANALWVTAKLNTLGNTGKLRTVPEREIVAPAAPGKIGSPGDATIMTGSATQMVKPDGRFQASARSGPAAEDDVKPLGLARGFDSVDATIALAARTNQAEEFNDYITATQKMRAYKTQQTVDKLKAKLNEVEQAEASAPNRAKSTYGKGMDTATVVAWIGVGLLGLIALALAAKLIFS
jgi:eukaryotic-like serine/threonine-protein kinase